MLFTPNGEIQNVRHDQQNVYFKICFNKRLLQLLSNTRLTNSNENIQLEKFEKNA